jgi:hypothetical protein
MACLCVFSAKAALPLPEFRHLSCLQANLVLMPSDLGLERPLCRRFDVWIRHRLELWR